MKGNAVTMGTLTELLQGLGTGSMPWPEYVRRMAEGQLADPGKGFIMPAFEAAHPEHPMTGANRFPRIEAADGLRNLARERTEPFPPSVLGVIYACLLDCCAAVRSSLALALFHAGDESSAGPLSVLLDLESRPDMPGRSAMAKRFARAALGRCAARGEVQFPPDRPLLLCLAGDVELAVGLADLADEHGLKFHQSHSAIDLVALTAVTQVVDPNLCRPEDWAAFRAYLRDVQRAAPDETDGTAHLDDNTPLLLVNCREAANRMDAGLEKPTGTVLRFGPGCTDVVLTVLRHSFARRAAEGTRHVTGDAIRLALESVRG